MSRLTRRPAPGPGATLLCAAVLLLGACGAPGTEQLLARADEAIDEGRLRAAMIDLRAAVANDPQNAEARFRLGTYSLAVADAASAEKELRRARELGYDAEAVAEPLTEAYLMLQRPDDALAEAARVETPSARLLALTGEARLQNGEDERALRDFHDALRLDPTEERALLGLAGFAARRGDQVSAESRYRAALEAHPESPMVRLGWGRYLYSRGKYAEAREQFVTGLDTPDAKRRVLERWELLISLAESHLTLGDYDQAAQAIAKVGEIRPDHVVSQFLQARLAFEQGDLDRADEMIKRVLVQAPDMDPAQLLQGSIHLARGEYPQARMFLQAFANKHPEDAQARRLLSAAEQGAEGIGRLSPADMLRLAGQSDLRDRGVGTSVAALEEAVAEEPDNAARKLDLLTGYLLAGEAEKAAALLADTQWDSDEQAVRAASLDTLFSVRDGRLEDARFKAAAAAAAHPDIADAIALQGIVEMAAQDDGRARAFFSRALEVDPSHTTAVINLARLDVKAGLLVDATRRLADFTAANPNDAVALTQLGKLYLQAGDRDSARRAMFQAAQDPGAADAREVLVQLLAQERDFEQGERIARELVQLRPQSMDAYNSLGIVLLAQGKSEEAIDVLQAATKLDPEALEPQRNLAQAYLAVGDAAQARATIDRLLALDAADAVGNELGLRLALAEGRLEDAEKFLRVFEEAGADEASTLLLRGEIAAARGDLTGAIDTFTASFEAEPSFAAARRLYEVRRRRGDDGAERELELWLTANPDNVPALLLLAQHQQGEGDLRAAIANYERAVELEPRSAVAMNNLAWVYSQVDDERALPLARQAAEIAPRSGAVKDTYGWLLVQSGELEEGIRTLREARTLAPGVPDIGYHLAEALVRAGQRGEAREVLEEVLGAGQQFPSRAEAEALLAQL